MRKIQLKLFDSRRNQNFWFHFCYIPQDLWEKYAEKFKATNMNTQVKEWIKQDFGLEVIHMDDLYDAKEHIKSLFAKSHPEIYLAGDGDHQGWTRVWLVEKIKTLLEENNG